MSKGNRRRGFVFCFLPVVLERVVLAKFWGGEHPLHERSKMKLWEVIMRDGRIMVMVMVTDIIVIMIIVITDS